VRDSSDIITINFLLHRWTVSHMCDSYYFHHFLLFTDCLILIEDSSSGNIYKKYSMYLVIMLGDLMAISRYLHLHTTMYIFLPFMLMSNICLVSTMVPKMINSRATSYMGYTYFLFWFWIHRWHTYDHDGLD
jgi:hypothetical protein